VGWRALTVASGFLADLPKGTTTSALYVEIHSAGPAIPVWNFAD